MKNGDLLQQCVEYFKGDPGFNRVFKKMKSKYKSLGKIGGKVIIINLSPQEKEVLSGFFRRDYSRQKQVTISLQKFEKALQETRYAGLLLEDILMKYFTNEEILSYKEEKNIFLKKREEFFEDIINENRGTTAGSWLDELFENTNNAYNVFMKRYNSDSDKLKVDIYKTAKALNKLPFYKQKKQRLAVFSTLITKNPHAFDQGTDLDTLLQYAIAYVLKAKKPDNAEERAELFYNAGILVNEVMNYTLCYGLDAFVKGKVHQGWDSFWLMGEPLLISLKNLSTLDRIVSSNGKVFVFENPAVFSTVLDKLHPVDMIHKADDLQDIAIKSTNNISLICTGGQLKLASLILLDLLVKEDTTIYYSGDFDPEGLGIADKLKNRYGNSLRLWRYGKSDYEKTLSKSKISNKSMSKLHNLKSKQLRELSILLRKYAVAGYQELLIDDLIIDIKNNA